MNKKVKRAAKSEKKREVSENAEVRCDEEESRDVNVGFENGRRG